MTFSDVFHLAYITKKSISLLLFKINYKACFLSVKGKGIKKRKIMSHHLYLYPDAAYR